MGWRLAKSLETLRSQINAAYPRRSKVSDGTIGDAAHATRSSDHNPYIKDKNGQGVVRAFDITRDPVNGPDLAKLIPFLLKDKRTRYVIFDKKIYNPAINSGAARPYSGVNAHQKHLHISVGEAAAHYDDASPWNIKGETEWTSSASKSSTSAPANMIPVTNTATNHDTLRRGDKYGSVPQLQAALQKTGDYKGKIDGEFGPKTEAAVKAFQARTGLQPDGVAGPLTWAKLASTAPLPGPEQTKHDPLEAVSYFKSLGWSDLASVCLVANLMWESGGNGKGTIIFDAHGDKDKDGVYRSHGAGQWNERAGRYEQLLAYAKGIALEWDHPRAQLGFLNRELLTTEKRAANALREAKTLEDAMTAAISIWRPSIPHADKRLAIARGLYDKL